MISDSEVKRLSSKGRRRGADGKQDEESDLSPNKVLSISVKEGLTETLLKEGDKDSVKLEVKVEVEWIYHVASTNMSQTDDLEVLFQAAKAAMIRKGKHKQLQESIEDEVEEEVITISNPKYVPSQFFFSNLHGKKTFATAQSWFNPSNSLL